MIVWKTLQEAFQEVLREANWLNDLKAICAEVAVYVTEK